MRECVGQGGSWSSNGTLTTTITSSSSDSYEAAVALSVYRRVASYGFNMADDTRKVRVEEQLKIKIGKCWRVGIGPKFVPGQVQVVPREETIV